MLKMPLKYAVELLALMVLAPAVMWVFLPSSALLPLLWAMALACLLIIRRVDASGATGRWNAAAVTRANLKPLLMRFVLCAVILLVATAWFKPELLFAFVRERPLLWAMVMVLYPVLSVVPQEIIYRRYLYARFELYCQPPWVMLAMSGVAFGFAHIVFGNWVAPLLCVVGGVFFAQTYMRSRSLALVCLEHALYGNLIFTLGLGRYFYHGAAA